MDTTCRPGTRRFYSHTSRASGTSTSWRPDVTTPEEGHWWPKAQEELHVQYPVLDMVNFHVYLIISVAMKNKICVHGIFFFFFFLLGVSFCCMKILAEMGCTSSWGFGRLWASNQRHVNGTKSGILDTWHPSQPIQLRTWNWVFLISGPRWRPETAESLWKVATPLSAKVRSAY